MNIVIICMRVYILGYCTATYATPVLLYDALRYTAYYCKALFCVSDVYIWHSPG